MAERQRKFPFMSRSADRASRGTKKLAKAAPKSYIAGMQNLLAEKLESHGVTEIHIRDVLDSGFFFTRIGSGFANDWKYGVKDSYYGNKPAGLFTIEEFAAYLGGQPPPRRQSITQHHTVRSLSDAQRILASDRLCEKSQPGF